MQSQKKKTALVTIALIIIFALPILLAQLFFMHPNWVSSKTNRGILLRQKVTMTDLSQQSWPNNDFKQWTLALLYPSHCTRLCQRQLVTLNNIRKATGKNQLRVTRALIQFRQSPAPLIIKKTGINHWEISKKAFDTKMGQKTLPKVQTNGSVYIISPQGELVLAYPSLKQPKAILKDLKRLLKANA